MVWHGAVVVLLALCSSQAVCQNEPGYLTSLLQNGLDYVNQQALDMLAAEVSKITIPEQSGKESHMHYTLRKHRIRTSGSVDVSVSGVSFSINVMLGRGLSGQVIIRPENCQSHVGGVNIAVRGHLRKVLKVFKHTVEKKIRTLLPGKLCQAVNDQVNENAAKQLKHVKAQIKKYHIVPVVVVAAVGVTVIVLLILSRVFPKPVAWLVCGALVSLGVWFLKTRLLSEMPELVDLVLALIS